MKQHRAPRRLSQWLTLATALLMSSTALAVPAFKAGVVATRSLVLGPSGLPVLAEFDAEGNVVDVIGETVGPLEGAFVMSAGAYRQYVLAYDTFMAQYGGNLAQGAYILLRSEYEQTSFVTAEDVAVARPALFASTLSVVVRHQSKIFSPQVTPLLFQSAIDLRNRITLAGDTRAVLLDKTGKVLRQAKVNIGYRVAFFTDPTTNYLQDASKDQRIMRKAGDVVWGPVFGAGIEVTIDPRARGVSGTDGVYSIAYEIPGCPGFTFDYEHDVIGQVFYKSFNPKSVRPWGSYYTSLRVYDFCSELSANLANAPDLAGQMARIDMMAIEATMAIPLVRADLRIDVNMITGNGAILGLDGLAPLGDATIYDEIPPPALPPPLDSAQLRAPRQATDLSHKGLLLEISKEDLEDTDIYVYRMSNDQLVTQRNGLKQGEYIPYNDQNTVENTFYYKMLIRGTRMADLVIGTRFGDTSTANLVAYQEKTQVNPELVGSKVDFLRVGERIKVIAINRATGYIGTAVATVGSGGAGRIDFPIAPLFLRPPNLKVRAERVFKVEAGLTAGAKRRNIIGFEGAGLATDQVIAITTEWVDRDGSPLPSDLEGYTGRLAKVVAPNQLGAVGGVAQFDIHPGTHLQLVYLPEEGVSTDHYYVQVSGQPSDRNPDFTSLGAGVGSLETRPAHYVPFRVPVFVEPDTKGLAELEAYILSSGWSPGEPAPVLTQLGRIYAWPYRPEMQFSLYDLKLTDLSSETKFGEAGLENTTEVTYNLGGPEQDPLAPLGPIDQLVLSLGYEEEGASFGEGQTTTFTDAMNIWEALGGLTPADYLSLQLYTSTDLGNMLYEFAGVPLVSMWPRRVVLERSYSQGAWDASLAATEDADVADSSQLLDFFLTDEADVEVAVLDAEETERGIIVPEKHMLRGRKFFLVTYDQITALGIKPRGKTDFYLEVRASGDTASGITRSHVVTLAGRLRELHEGVILGQIFQHDVLIQDGSLHLSRPDFNFPGRGPAFGFGRTYNNRDARKDGMLGQGWNHSLDHSLMPMRWKETIPVPGGYPKWVKDKKETFFTRADLPPPSDDPELERVAVSTGGQFKKVGGAWYGQRGQHGRLVESSNGFDYYSKDGTQYHFNKPVREAIEEPPGEDDTTPKWVDVEDLAVFPLGVHPTLLKLGSEEGVDLAGYGSTPPEPVRYIADRNNNKMTFEYRWFLDLSGEAQPHVSTVTDSSGRVILLDYEQKDFAEDENGDPIMMEVRQEPGTKQQLPKQIGWRLMAVRAPSVDVEVYFEYDDKGLLAAARRLQKIERYTYVAQEDGPDLYNLSVTQDSLGRQTQYAYLPVAQVPAGLLAFVVGLKRGDVIKSVTYPDGGVITFGYEFGSGNVRTVRDAKGNTTRYVLNAVGNPLRIEEPAGKTQLMTWSVDEGLPDNVMTSSTDALGRVRRFEYDAQGNVNKETDPAGKITLRTWDPTYSRLLTETDRNGNTLTNTYDARGNQLTETNALGKSIQHSYNGVGDLLTSTDRNGNVTTFTYDSYGNLASQIAPTASGQASTTMAIDARGRVLSVTNARGFTQTFEYDALDRLVSDTDHEGYRYTAQYDSEGNKTREVTKRGLVLNHTYDARNRLVTTSRSIDGATKTRTHDINGNMLTETDWKGQVTTHAYDALNRRTTTTDRKGNVSTVTYDLAGNIQSMVDAVGRTRSFTYDPLNRPLTVTATDAGTTTTTYDPEGRVLTVTNALGQVTTTAYDAASRVISETDAAGNSVSFTYDDNGNLIQKVDREGKVWTHEYDGGNRLIKSTDPLGNSSTTSYDASGNAVSTVDAEGRQSTSTYDGMNRVVSFTDALGGEWTTTYGPEGEVVATVDAEGRERTSTFDILGRLTVRIDAVGALTRYDYDRNDNIVKVTDPLGMVTTSVFDEMDRLISQTRGVGGAGAQTSTISYDAVGRKLTEVDAAGAVTSYAYNGLDGLTQMTDPSGQVWKNTFDLLGRRTAAIDPQNRRTTYAYDALGRVTSTIRNPSGSDPVGITTQVTFDKVGNAVSVRAGVTQANATGRLTTRVFDALGRAKTVTTAGVTVEENTYDKVGNLVSVRDALGRTTSTDYDDLNRPTRVTYPDSSFVTYEYDKVGNLVRETDEVGDVTRHTYDAENRVTSDTNGANETVSYVLDKRGGVTKHTRPKGNVRVVEYDNLARPVEVRDAVGSVRMQYDVVGNLVRRTDPMNNSIDFTYDLMRRRTAIRQSAPSGNIENRFTYNTTGGVATWLDPNGNTVTYTYDAHGREKSRTYPALVTSYRAPRSTEMSYDAFDRTTKTKEFKWDATATPGQELGDKSTNMTYDAFGRVLTFETRGVIITYTYDSVGNRLSMNDGTTTVTYTYDARNRLLTVSRGGTLAVTYTYRNDGLVSSASFPDHQVVYTYDAGKRLKRLTNQVPGSPAVVISDYQYTYDTNGNVIARVESQSGMADEVTLYTYDTADRLTQFDTTASGSPVLKAQYTLDAAGNRLAEKVTTLGTTTITRLFIYDMLNRLTTISEPSGTVTFTYDDNGNVLSKVDTRSGSPVRTLYEFDARDQLVQVKTGPTGSEAVVGTYDYDYRGYRIKHRQSGRGTIDYFYDGSRVIRESGIADYTYGRELVRMDTAAAETFHYTQDGLGSVSNLVASGGAVEVSYRYDPWGKQRTVSGNAAHSNRFSFTGKPFDDRTGLVYFGARYYDPDLGRFITQDSVLGLAGAPVSLNRYAYANVSPLNYIDPTGHFATLRNWADDLKGVGDDLKGYSKSLKKESTSWTEMVSLGAARFLTSGAEGVLRLANYGANLVAEPVARVYGKVTGDSTLSDSLRTELMDTHTAIVDTVDYVVNKGGGADIYEHMRAVATDAFDGEPYAIVDVIEMSLNLATLKGAPRVGGRTSDLARMTNEAGDGVGAAQSAARLTRDVELRPLEPVQRGNLADDTARWRELEGRLSERMKNIDWLDGSELQSARGEIREIIKERGQLAARGVDTELYHAAAMAERTPVVPGKYLGGGAFGDAFDMGDGTVFKRIKERAFEGGTDMRAMAKHQVDAHKALREKFPEVVPARLGDEPGTLFTKMAPDGPNLRMFKMLDEMERESLGGMSYSALARRAALRRGEQYQAYLDSIAPGGRSVWKVDPNPENFVYEIVGTEVHVRANFDPVGLPQTFHSEKRVRPAALPNDGMIEFGDFKWKK